MRFRTRRDYEGDVWAGQMFTIEKPHPVWPRTGGSGVRFTLWWRNRNPYIKLPVEIQIRRYDKRAKHIPPRRDFRKSYN